MLVLTAGAVDADEIGAYQKEISARGRDSFSFGGMLMSEASSSARDWF
jgi:hypothetical protein